MAYENKNNRVQNATLISQMTPHDVEVLVGRVIDERMKKFWEAIQPKADPLIKRREAAKMLGVSLPTLDNYAKAHILHAQHRGGRVFFLESELLTFKQANRK